MPYLKLRQYFFGLLKRWWILLVAGLAAITVYTVNSIATAQTASQYRLPYPFGQTCQLSRGVFGTGQDFHPNEGGYNTHAYDFASCTNGTVVASRAGKIISLYEGSVTNLNCKQNMPSNWYQFTNYVLIDHGGGQTSIYAHLKKDSVPVNVGDSVRQGQVIGEMSNTGWACGVHLHYAVQQTPSGSNYGNTGGGYWQKTIYSSFADPDVVNRHSDGVPLSPNIYKSANSSGLLDSKVFDPQYYLKSYTDLQKAFGSNYQAATNHWLTYGIREGRRGSRSFDPKFYLNSYQDLQRAFGVTGYEAAINHWLTYGIKEGRKSSPALDVIYYLGKYQDLQQAFGVTGYEAAINHWLTYGIKEGRKSSPKFDVSFYLSKYSDLQRAYGSNNYSEGVDHWLIYGINEGREGVPSNSVLGGVNLNGYCQSVLGSTASAILIENTVYGWRCKVNGLSQVGIYMGKACQWQYGTTFVSDYFEQSTNPYSWKCRYNY
jgi:murein DD-endopeptidase MepM/ murein hydrolase activator NlpD